MPATYAPSSAEVEEARHGRCSAACPGAYGCERRGGAITDTRERQISSAARGSAARKGECRGRVNIMFAATLVIVGVAMAPFRAESGQAKKREVFQAAGCAARAAYTRRRVSWQVVRGIEKGGPRR